mgnify:CR=1 FL=1
MKKILIFIIFLIFSTIKIQACSIYENFIEGIPFFIADGLLPEEFRDASFYEGICHSKYLNSLEKDNKNDLNNLLKQVGAPAKGSELEKYLSSHSKTEDIWEPLPPITEDDYKFCMAKVTEKGMPYSEKRRWVYQAIRAAHILALKEEIKKMVDTSENTAAAIRHYYEKIIMLYEKYFASENKMDVIHYRAMGRYAQALGKTGKKIEALEIYINLYDLYPPYRYRIINTLKMGEWNPNNPNAAISLKDINDYFALKKDKHKQIILAFIFRDLNRLKELEPGSPRIFAIIVERVMSNESRYLKKIWPALISKPGEKIEKDNPENNRLFEFKNPDEKFLKDAKNEDKALLLAICGYLNSIAGDTEIADQYFIKCEKTKPKGMIKGQLHLFKTINEMIKNPGKISDDIQRMAIEDLEWLDSINDRSYNKLLRENYLALLGGRFFYSGDIVRAAACFNCIEKSNIGKYLIDIYASPEQISNMEDFVSGINAQPIDKYLLARSNFAKGDMKYLMALKYLRKRDYKKALELIESANGWGIWQKNLLTIDGAVLPRPRQELSKYETIKLLYELSLPEKNAERQAEKYYKLASIYYFCPYLSYADIIWNGMMFIGMRQAIYDFGMSDYLIDRDKAEEIVKNFYEVEYNNKKIAEEYIQKALKLTKNNELKAKCEMILLLNKTRELGIPFYFWQQYQDKAKFIKLDENYQNQIKNKIQEEQNLLKIYKDKFQDTEFYKNYINSCAIMKQKLEQRNVEENKK